ncbi:DNA/RNA non-specific endonuclease [Haloferula sp. BvORR071]|uniref:DNA/RNA non-specific endonuclease n=1 Tax=Haloferula sp. BvORR071 TaxID=1396141 RepID=UPI000550D2F3|nr:DNA/RNA non-specific endonuclease [Haloferula sp. BvORR071]
MSLDLEKLLEAADRYEDHTAAATSASRAAPPGADIEQAAASERHDNLFVPASERLARRATRSVIIRDVRGSRGIVPPLVEVPALAPEIISRDNDLRPIRFLQMGVLAARSVGKIRVADGPQFNGGDATGFMVAPGILITNWHVLPTEDHAAASSVIFNDEDDLNGDPKDPRAFRLRPDLLFVNDEKLDYALVAVTPQTSGGVPLAQFGYLRLFEQTGKLDPKQREAANIVQHPGGGPKKIALRDNYIEPVVPDAADPGKQLSSLFYGTDTLKGSSGSPVCSDQWYVVALHRGGVPETQMIDGKRVAIRWDGQPASEKDSLNDLRYIKNEGTRVSRIYQSLREIAADAGAQRQKHAAMALEKLGEVSRDPRTGPFDLLTAPLMLPTLPGVNEGGGPEELLRRSADKFKDASGYKPGFLGRTHKIPLPGMSSEVKREVATLRDSTETELKYQHYSLVMNRERRTAFYVAANIDGALHWKQNPDLGALPPRPSWSFDPRMEDKFQPDDGIFSNAMQRGHLFKREDASWGADREEMALADQHSFTITNATPMIGNFNNVEWGDLEDIVSKEAMAGHKVSYFAGPIFRSDDPFFNELRSGVPAAERRKGMRVPQSFWKIVAWIEDSTLKATGFILDQRDEIEAHGPITEEIDFGTYKSRPISEIEAATGLRFPALRAAEVTVA